MKLKFEKFNSGVTYLKTTIIGKENYRPFTEQRRITVVTSRYILKSFQDAALGQANSSMAEN